MGTRTELADLIAFLIATGVRPTIDRTLPLDRIAEGSPRWNPARS